MSTQNWIDLGLLTLIAVWIGTYIWHVVKTRHRYKVITVQRGLGRITVEGYDMETALELIKKIEERS